MTKSNSIGLRPLILSFILTLASSMCQAQEHPANWPKEVPTSQGTIVLYQPQPQELNGNDLSGTAAFSILPVGKKEPLFGALFFVADLEFDRDNHLYSVRTATVTNVRFSDQDSTIDLEKLKSVIISSVPGWNLSGSTDQLITTVEKAGKMADHTGFKNDAPVILYRNKPAVLVLIDGEPKLQQMDGSSVKRIINTPFIIMKPEKDSSYYLYGGDHWMKSSSLTSGWALTKNVPSSVKKAMEKSAQPSDTSSAMKTDDDGVVPEIVVSTVPAELLQTKGNPEFKPVTGTGLLYVDNTDDYIFREISSQKFFILKSGRWYASGGLDGGWKYIPSDSIPADFAKIPPGSDMDAVLASVPGTPQAKDAVLDAQVPQTATVDRKTAGKNATVTYDGAPKFEPVDGTSLFLAVNASKTVFRSGSMYYLVDNGIWFESKNYNGPWEVSTSRPADVDKIPPSSSAYNTRYVYIYDHTPDVVYVGYTPGYMGAYVVGPTVVYGTGYYYNPWYGTTYYARPCTWGFSMHYSPWTGWSMSVGYTAGPWSFGFGGPAYAYGGGWFGPPMYYPHYYYPPRYYGPSRGYYGPRPGYTPVSGGYNRGRVPAGYTAPRQNIYDRPGGNNGVRSGMSGRDAQNMNIGNGARPVPNRSAVAGNAAGRTNNVFSDRDGNVYRQNNDGWQQNRGGDRWENANPSPASKAGGLNNQSIDRARGAERFNGYQQNRMTPSGGGGFSRPGGMGGARPMPGRR
ncbi:MAG: hypothetical protein ACK5CT_06795 [Bacteroidota bacterium]